MRRKGVCDYGDGCRFAHSYEKKQAWIREVSGFSTLRATFPGHSAFKVASFTGLSTSKKASFLSPFLTHGEVSSKLV